MADWTATAPPQPAGDHFGDDQAPGVDAVVVTHTLQGRPHTRISTYFGVLKKHGRYAVTGEIVFEALDSRGEVVAEQEHGMGDQLPLTDHTDPAAAEAEMHKSARAWAASDFTATEMFDGDPDNIRA